MENNELSVLGSSFRGKSRIKNFKVELSPVTSSLEETLSNSYHMSPAREKICHENPSGLADLCRGGDFCQQRLLSDGKHSLLRRCEISGEGRLAAHVAAGENASRRMCYFRKAKKDQKGFQRTKKSMWDGWKDDNWLQLREKS